MPKITKIIQNSIARIDSLSKRLVAVMNQREEPNQALSAPDQDLFANAGTLYWQKLVQNPEKLFTQQVEFWAGSLQNFIYSQQASVLTSDQSEPQSEETDPRFSHPMW